MIALRITRSSGEEFWRIVTNLKIFTSSNDIMYLPEENI